MIVSISSVQYETTLDFLAIVNFVSDMLPVAYKMSLLLPTCKSELSFDAYSFDELLSTQLEPIKFHKNLKFFVSDKITDLLSKLGFPVGCRFNPKGTKYEILLINIFIFFWCVSEENINRKTNFCRNYYSLNVQDILVYYNMWLTLILPLKVILMSIVSYLSSDQIFLIIH